MRFTWRRVGAVLALLLLLTVSLVPPPAAASNTGDPTYYWVKPGDTLFSIGRHFGVSPWSIAQANHITNMDKIYVGQRLVIPTSPVGPCGWSPCPTPQPQPGPCGWNPCLTPQPPPGPCGWNPCPPATPGPMVANWRGVYYNSTDLRGNVVWTANTPTVDFNWGGNSPGGSVNATNWSATFTAVPNLQGGRYRVQVATDDGARVYIDGWRVIDAWNVQSATTFSLDVQIGPGNHTICVEYFQAEGLSELRFYMWRL